MCCVCLCVHRGAHEITHTHKHKLANTLSCSDAPHSSVGGLWAMDGLPNPPPRGVPTNLFTTPRRPGLQRLIQKPNKLGVTPKTPVCDSKSAGPPLGHEGVCGTLILKCQHSQTELQKTELHNLSLNIRISKVGGMGIWSVITRGSCIISALPLVLKVALLIVFLL
jgi:hypothetical protein